MDRVSGGRGDAADDDDWVMVNGFDDGERPARVATAVDGGAPAMTDEELAFRLQFEEDAGTHVSDEELARRLSEQEMSTEHHQLPTKRSSPSGSATAWQLPQPPSPQARHQPPPPAAAQMFPTDGGSTLSALLGSVITDFQRAASGAGGPVLRGAPRRVPAQRGFRQEFQAYSHVTAGAKVPPLFDHGDKLLLPPATLHELSGRNLLSDSGDGRPTLFRIGVRLSDNTELAVHGGVLEFTAPEGCVVVPTWMLTHLCVDEGTKVVVQSVKLPSATYARLRPVNYQEFKLLENHKAVLESSLRSFFTLTKGATITLPFRGQDYIFEVVDTKPADAVCILNADVETEFDLPEDYFHRSSPAPLTTATAAPAGGAASDAAATAAVSPSADGALGAPVKAFSLPGRSLVGESSERSEGSVECTSCGKWVPGASYQRHLAFCERNVWRCPDCGERLAKTEQDAHFTSRHAPVECECGSVVPLDMLATHKEFECTMRPAVCQWCELPFTAAEQPKHELLCGARTERCPVCHEYIMLRDMTMHRESACTYKSNTYKGAELFMCDACDSPFASADQLARHMTDFHTEAGKLAREERDRRENDALLASLGAQKQSLLHCPHCHQPFASFDVLETHVKLVHDVLMDGSDSDFQGNGDDDDDDDDDDGGAGSMSLSNSDDEV